MRLIQQQKDNDKILEVAWMWLPTFIGQNTALLGELDHALSVRFPPPLEVSDKLLDEIHRFVIDWICSKLNIPGLWHYLRSIEMVDAEIPEAMKELHEMTTEVLSPRVDWAAVDRGEEVVDRVTGFKIKKVGDPEKGVQ